jgi:penicillin V acylase-like amidase (Ntn superfamily)
MYTTLKQQLSKKVKMNSELQEQQLQSTINSKTPTGTVSHRRNIKAIQTKEAAAKARKTLKFLKAQSGATQALNRIDIPSSWPGPLDPIPP